MNRMFDESLGVYRDMTPAEVKAEDRRVARLQRDVWDRAVAAHRLSADGADDSAAESRAADGNWYALTGLSAPYAIGMGVDL